MGIYDRDYMRQESAPPAQGIILLIRALGVIGSVVVLFILLRIPLPLPAKLVLLAAVVFGFRWLLVLLPRRIEGDFLFERGRHHERNGDKERAVADYEQALLRLPGESSILLRLLAAYDSALHVQKAKELITRLDGRSFAEREVEELEALITPYREVTFERKGSRHIVRLGARKVRAEETGDG
ncbi:MAG TPA: hypothetical protein DCY13_24060 [Verrucomicrobiales bacterium]|nr:hypothetical protein [Verrucomicrobiales bacterium]